MSNHVRRVGICRVRYSESEPVGELMREIEVRAFVRDVLEEDGGAPRVEWTPLRDEAARYFDPALAHRVADVVRKSGAVGRDELVRVFRARLPQ